MVEITRIIQELEQQREAIDKALSALRGVGRLSSETGAATKKAGPRKRQMSEEGRKRIAEAARKRWAEQRGTATKAPAVKRGRKSSAKKTAAKATKKATSKKQAVGGAD